MVAKKILMIVDDDADDRMFFHEAVDNISTGYACSEARGGQEALDLLRNSEKLPDFIFLDLNMPRMDGNQFLVELKKDQRLKDTPVIIYSTSAFEVDVERTREMGAAHFLTKTAHIDRLPGIILLALQRARPDILQR